MSNKVEMTDNLKIGENRIEDIRNPDGTFKKGTQIGRMKKKGFSLTDLTKVAMKYDKTHDLTILAHYIEQLFIDNRLLDKFIDRYVPPKNINEITGAGGEPIRPFIMTTVLSFDNCPLKDTGECPMEKEVERLQDLKYKEEQEARKNVKG